MCDSKNTYDYKGKKITITKSNYKDYRINKIGKGNYGNDGWEGFLYVSVKGGKQEKELSHKNDITIFNPACEYASADVGKDINLVMSFFALKSIKDVDLQSKKDKNKYKKLVDELTEALKTIDYNINSTRTSLYDYCVEHDSLSLSADGKLYDPIDVKPIEILDFAIKDRTDVRNIDFTHNEAVKFAKYYWDANRKTVLSPARPTNVFWSKHTSNMTQQDYTLSGFYDAEEQRYKKRKTAQDDRNKRNGKI